MSKDNTELLNRITGWADIDRKKLGIPIVFRDELLGAVVIAFGKTTRYALVDQSALEDAMMPQVIVAGIAEEVRDAKEWNLRNHPALKRPRVTRWVSPEPKPLTNEKLEARVGYSVSRYTAGHAWSWCAADEARPVLPIDPLDVLHDGCSMRELLKLDESTRRESWRPFIPTPNQRAAVSAYWSAQLRAKVDATKQAERTQVVCDKQDEV